MIKRSLRMIVSVCALLLIFSFGHGGASTASASTVTTLDGGELVQGRTLVPLRSIFEELGATVKWDQKTKKITATKDNRKIILTVGSKNTYVNGSHVVIDVPAQVKRGVTLVPLRFISESFGGSAKWDSKKSQAFIKVGTKEIAVKVAKPQAKLSRGEIRSLVNRAAGKQFSFDSFQNYTRKQIDNRLSPYFTNQFIDQFLYYRWENEVRYGTTYYHFYGSDDLSMYIDRSFLSWTDRTKISYSQNSIHDIITITEYIPKGSNGLYSWDAFTYKIQLVKGIHSNGPYKINDVT